MRKQFLLFALITQPIFTMEAPSVEPSTKQQQAALKKYKKSRDSLFCGMYFFNKDDSEQEKETYIEQFKKIYRFARNEACIGCGICTAATAIACAAIPFTCDGQFCGEHPLAWLCCCALKCGAIGIDTAIVKKVCGDCLRYLEVKETMKQVQAVEQLRPIQVKVKGE